MVAAAGSGSRFGFDAPKQFVAVGGRPLLAHTLSALEAAQPVETVVVVVPPDDVEFCRLHYVGGEFLKVKAVVAGGGHRALSVRAGVECLAGLCSAPYLGVHDAARPLVQSDLVERLVAALGADPSLAGAIPGLIPTDTVKSVDSDGVVLETPARGGLRLAQTPQVFRREALIEAYAADEKVLLASTDDASLVERWGGRVATVEGSPHLLKVTHPRDAEMVERLLEGRSPEPVLAGSLPDLRVGLGLDAHRFAPTRALVLGGVRVREERGLEGHSDADVVVHAAMDALLGAAGLEDIGRHFPDTDPAYAGADSLRLLEEVGRMLARVGYVVANLDCVVVCEEPRVAPHREAMQCRMAQALGVEAGRVGVRGTTTEGMGFTGRGEGIAAQAVALLVRSGPAPAADAASGVGGVAAAPHTALAGNAGTTREGGSPATGRVVGRPLGSRGGRREV